MWAIIYGALGIERRLFLAYHSETDGAMERETRLSNLIYMRTLYSPRIIGRIS